jgi:transposase-like protein
MKPNAPTTLVEAIEYFADPKRSLDHMAAIRWPDGVTCPSCGCKTVSFLKTRRIWKCSVDHPKRQFSVKVGTIFEDSPIPLNKWFAAIWLLSNCKNGVSSHEIHRDLGTTQRTAWFVLHRVRLALHTGSFEKKLSREIEIDETFVGERSRNMHRAERMQKITGTGGVGKTAVVALLERHGEVRAQVVPNVRKKTLAPIISEHVESSSTVYTDQLRSYQGLEDDYVHHVINHAEKYVDGRIHTNGAENFWSVLKRTLKGTYIHVAPFQLDRYIDEQTWRFNNRKTTDGGRFEKAVSSVIGKRLTYRELTGADDEAKQEAPPTI